MTLREKRLRAETAYLKAKLKYWKAVNHWKDCVINELEFKLRVLNLLYRE